MANRAYLYTTDQDLTSLKDVSEWNYDIPLMHKILLGSNPELSSSKIWDYEHPIAIKADFQKGLDTWYAFLEYLQTQKFIKQEIVSKAIKETQDFFAEYPEKINQKFFLEAGEIYDLSGDIDPLEKQNNELLLDIKYIAKDINQLIKEKPENALSLPHSYWLKELAEDNDKLEVYWTQVTYFSFNNV